MDATYLIQFNQTLRRLTHFLQQLQHASLLVDQEGMVVEVNEALLRTTGFHRQELVGSPFQNILDYPRTIEQLHSQLLQQDLTHDGNTECAWLNKEGKTSKTAIMITKEHAGDPYYLVHLYELTYVRPYTLQERLVSELTFESNLGVVVLNTAGQIVELSQLACKLLGVERTQVINQHMDQAFAGIPEEYRLIQREVLEGIKVQNKATSWTNDQQRYELLVDSNTLHDESGEMVGAYVIFKDVTNLRSFGQKIERSDRLAMIGQIAAGTAHEIRNPLTSIKGFLQMFYHLFTDMKMERERGYTEIMLTEINRINSLVSEFLLLSKPRDVQYQLVNLNVVFEEILPIVENQALLHGIDLQYKSRGQLCMVVGDAELLKQVFINICKNGIEAMGSEGTLTIGHHFEEEGNRISIDIHDTGPGIPLYVIDKIFDPFFTTKEEGTGLGLSVCQKIIHDIGGQIRVSSKGYGTTFQILLPYM
ncbi:ATP-binding protein [Brevibacillus ginsengisoli]|uniref:ATP-binding protein n=1 Tax=Brevibacillus ginsengisoli TaxID=363854 RepID=UPI003CEF8989